MVININIKLINGNLDAAHQPLNIIPIFTYKIMRLFLYFYLISVAFGMMHKRQPKKGGGSKSKSKSKKTEPIRSFPSFGDSESIFESPPPPPPRPPPVKVRPIVDMVDSSGDPPSSNSNMVDNTAADPPSSNNAPLTPLVTNVNVAPNPPSVQQSKSTSATPPASSTATSITTLVSSVVPTLSIIESLTPTYLAPSADSGSSGNPTASADQSSNPATSSVIIGVVISIVLVILLSVLFFFAYRRFRNTYSQEEESLDSMIDGPGHAKKYIPSFNVATLDYFTPNETSAVNDANHSSGIYHGTDGEREQVFERVGLDNIPSPTRNPSYASFPALKMPNLFMKQKHASPLKKVHDRRISEISANSNCQFPSIARSRQSTLLKYLTHDPIDEVALTPAQIEAEGDDRVNEDQTDNEKSLTDHDEKMDDKVKGRVVNEDVLSFYEDTPRPLSYVPITMDRQPTPQVVSNTDVEVEQNSLTQVQ